MSTFYTQYPVPIEGTGFSWGISGPPGSNSSFSFISTKTSQVVNAKFNSVTSYTGINGRQYAVCCGSAAATMVIFDVTDQFFPVLLSSTVLLGAYDVSVATINGATYCFVPSSGGFVLYIYNITNPSTPTLTGSINLLAATGSLYSCIYSAGYVYIATQNKGLTVIDVGGGAVGGTLTAPVESFQEGGTTNKSFGVAISGNYVFTTNYQTTSPYTIRQIKSWIITGAGTPSVPSLVQSLQVPTAGEALGVSLSENTAFVSVIASGVNSINLVDVTNPASMSNLSQITPTYSLASGMVAKGNGKYLYIPSGSNATHGGAIDCYDITNRNVPVKKQTIMNNIPSCVFGSISLQGIYIYVGDYASSGTLASLDIYTQYFY